MKIIKSVSEMKKWSEDIRGQGHTISFVPTLGDLHEGHLLLVRKAQSLSDNTVVSIFVNPAQFGPDEDFESYPRVIEKDSRKLALEKVSVLFNPDRRHMYSKGFQTRVDVRKVSQGLCGNSRPGHFKGVATVVLKLFNISCSKCV